MDNVVHFEIPVDDVEKATDFYKKIFGWDINKAGDMPYWVVHTAETDSEGMIKENGAINGGILPRDKAEDPSGVNPVIVIKVSDVEEYCKKVSEAGGKVVLSARPVGDMGVYARVEDTEGNVIGLWHDLKKS